MHRDIANHPSNRFQSIAPGSTPSRSRFATAMITLLPPSAISARTLTGGTDDRLDGVGTTISSGRALRITSCVERRTVVTCDKEMSGELGKEVHRQRTVCSARPSRGRYSANELFCGISPGIQCKDITEMTY